MTTALTPIVASRLEKAAIDNGFDRELVRIGDWLSFASTQCPLRIWLATSNEGTFHAALSQAHVANELSEYRVSTPTSSPPDVAACLEAANIPELHHLIHRAFQLSKTLPDEPLRIFERKTRLLPQTTEAERLVTQRIGQDIFRDALIDYWSGACADTGIALTPVLRASHMKPWSRCGDDAERLNVFNGILLVANLDALFDQGLISFEDSGTILISARINAECRELLQLHSAMGLRSIATQHLPFLAWHREYLLKDI